MAGGELVPFGALHGVDGDRAGFLEGHPLPPIGKKAAPKDGLCGGRICTYVPSIKGTPRTVLLSAIPIFPYAGNLIKFWIIVDLAGNQADAYKRFNRGRLWIGVDLTGNQTSSAI